MAEIGQLWPNSGGAPQSVGQLWPRASGAGAAPQGPVEFIGAGPPVAVVGTNPSPTVEPPEGVQDGDLLLWFLWSATTGSNEAFTMPDGWSPSGTGAGSALDTVLFGPVLNIGHGGCPHRFYTEGDSPPYVATTANHSTSEPVVSRILAYRNAALYRDPAWASVASSAAAPALTSGSFGPFTPNGPAVAGGVLPRVVPPGGAVLFMVGSHDEQGVTTLGGDDDGLTWTLRVNVDTDLGNDAGLTVWEGYNGTDDPITVTEKTLLGAGITSQDFGYGFMFVVAPA